MKEIHLGYELGTGLPVSVPIRHMAVTGQTQESGKTTTLEALISRTSAPAIAFVTKRGERSFSTAENSVLPFFVESADWAYVTAILESLMRERFKFERAWIVRACRQANSLADVEKNCHHLHDKAKNVLAQDMYMLLGEYLSKVVPLIRSLPKTSSLTLRPGLNVMDLSRYPAELQMLVIGSTLQEIYQHHHGVITIIPEAWKFVPQSRKTPVKMAVELLAREGAALGNFIWLDAQDLAGVDKLLLRACAVWLMGVQREANEVKRVLLNMPYGIKKPKAEQIIGLGLGQFFVSNGQQLRRTYVQPAWMKEDKARAIAALVEDPGATARAVRHFAPGLEAPASQEAEKRDHIICPDPHPAFAHLELDGEIGPENAPGPHDNCPHCPHSLHHHAEMPYAGLQDEGIVFCLVRGCDCKRPLETGGKQSMEWTIGTLCNRYSEATKKPLSEFTQEEYGVLQTLLPILNGSRSGTIVNPAKNGSGPEGIPDINSIADAVISRIKRDPVLIRLSQEKPIMEISIQRKVVSVDGTSLRGRLAGLISTGLFSQPRNFKEVKKELTRRGLDPKTPNVRIAEALKEFTEQGFFFRGDDETYELTEDAVVRVVP